MGRQRSENAYMYCFGGQLQYQQYILPFNLEDFGLYIKYHYYNFTHCVRSNTH